MAIGRISGSVLKSNLTRNGTDLAFETNLLYLDVTNNRVGVGTSEPTTALDVAGTIKATAFSGDGSGLTGINVSTNIQIVGDDSTGAVLGTGETFKIAGTQNITTAVSGDTLTITGPDLSSYATTSYVDAQNTAQALTFVGDDSTGTAVNSGETFKIAGGTNITTAVSGDTLTITGTAQDFAFSSLTGTPTTLSGYGITDAASATATALTVVGDDSTGTAITLGETFKFSGTGGISASVSGDTLTVDGSSISTNSISEGNSNVTVTDSGTGSITIDADGSTIVTFNATTAIDASAANNAIRLPNGSTAERPSGSVGMIRYNSSTDTIEGYTTAGGWAQLGAATAAAEDSANVVTGEKTAISTNQTVVDSFLPATYDSAFYLAVTRDEINEEVATAKYSVVHNDSSAFVSQSSITQSGSNEHIVVDADISGGNVRLLATGTSVVNSVSFYRIALGDNTTQATTGNVTTEITADVDSAVASIDSWTLADARGAKYFISVNNATTGELSNIEAIVVHDDSSAFITSYNAVNTGNNDLITLTAEVDSTAVVLKASANAPNCRVTAYRILLADDETSATGDFIDIVGSKTVDSSATAIDTFLTSVYTGAHYVVVGYNATEGSASIQEVTVISDGAGAFVTTGPLVSSKDTDQLTFTAELSGTTVTLKAASSAGSSTTVNAYRVHLLRGIAGASTANTVLVDTTQTITGAKTFDSPIALTVGADPATVADKAHIYAKDEAASAEVYVRDEAGNVTKISPHNQQGEWEYYSRNTKTGKTVRVNMEEMIRDIEKLTGKTYIQDK